MGFALKIAVCGWYGAGNLGDEAILSAIIEGMGARIPGCTFHVFSKDPDRTSSVHSVESSSLKLLALPRSLKILRECDAFILGGGGFLHKHSSSMKWMSRPTVAQLMNIPVVFYAIGVDKTVLQSLGARKLIGRTANKAHLITVRDENSKEVLLEMGVKKPIHVTIDPVFGLRPPNKEVVRKLLLQEGLESSSYVLISPGLPGYSWDQIDSRKYDRALASTIDHIVERFGTIVLLVPFKLPQDVDLCNRLREAADRKESVKVLERQYSPKEILGLFSECWFAICARYHGNIFATISGVPFVSIMYIPEKHKPLLDQAGMTEFGLPIQEVDSSKLVKMVSRLVESEEDVRATLAERRKVFDARVDRNLDLFLDLIEKS